MHQSKLLELLRKLSPRQLNRFGEFLQSPYFNKNTENTSFFSYLQTFAPGFGQPALAKEAVIEAAPSEGLRDERSLAYRMNELMQLLEQFLAVEYLQAHPLEEQLSLMETYRQMELDKHYNSALKRAQRLLEQQAYRDGPFLRARYRMAELGYLHSQQYQRDYRAELQQAADALDQAYLAEKLRYNLEMVNYKEVLDVDYQLNLGEAVLQWAQQQGGGGPPIVKLYLNALLMLQQPEEQQYFHSLHHLLQEHETIMPPPELKNLYTCLLNHCTRRINHYRDRSYLGHFLDINQSLLDKGLLLEDGRLAPWRYSNLVTVGLATGRLEWAQRFLENYKNLLPEDFRDNIYNFNLAHCLYYQKDYGRAQVLLNQLDLRDPLLAIAAKNLLVKIYYETGQTELLLSFLEAYRIYLYRQDLAKPKLKEQARNFIDLTRKLARLAPFETEKRLALAGSLPPATDIFERDWLLRMIGEGEGLYGG